MIHNIKFHKEKIQGMTILGLKLFINLTSNDAEVPNDIKDIAANELASRLTNDQFVVHERK